MDLQKMIDELYAEKAKLERVIAALELMQRTGDSPPEVPRAPTRRGRKSMGLKERQDVSERMKKYWAGRRPNENEEVPAE